MVRCFRGGAGDLKRLLKLFEQDELLRQRYGHKAWREALSNHTFNHRLNVIAEDLHLSHKKRIDPLVSIVTPTRRLENIETIIENFDRQIWPRKELLIVANMDYLPKNFKRPDVVSHISVVPQDGFAGEALNEGIAHASGKYVFRFDDDDEYGENYCLDMILAAEAWNLDFFGKPRGLFYRFEGENGTYSLRSKMENSYVIFCPPEESALGFNSGLSGNSFGGKKNFFEDNIFLTFNYSAADVFFQDNLDVSQYRVAKFDTFNVLVERRQDQSTHTWKKSKSDLLKVAKKYGCSFDHFYPAFC